MQHGSAWKCIPGLGRLSTCGAKAGAKFQSVHRPVRMNAHDSSGDLPPLEAAAIEDGRTLPHKLIQRKFSQRPRRHSWLEIQADQFSGFWRCGTKAWRLIFQMDAIGCRNENRR